MARQAGQSLSVEDIQTLEQTAEVTEVEDIDVDEWLSDEATKSIQPGHVDLDGRRLKVMPITEDQENALIRMARKPDPKNPREHKTDVLAYRRLYIAFSLGMASGRVSWPLNSPDLVELQQLANKLKPILPGKLTRLQNEIQRLSAYDLPDQQPRVDPFSVFD